MDDAQIALDFEELPHNQDTTCKEVLDSKPSEISLEGVNMGVLIPSEDYFQEDISMMVSEEGCGEEDDVKDVTKWAHDDTQDQDHSIYVDNGIEIDIEESNLEDTTSETTLNVSETLFQDNETEIDRHKPSIEDTESKTDVCDSILPDINNESPRIGNHRTESSQQKNNEASNEMDKCRNVVSDRVLAKTDEYPLLEKDSPQISDKDVVLNNCEDIVSSKRSTQAKQSVENAISEDIPPTLIDSSCLDGDDTVLHEGSAQVDTISCEVSSRVKDVPIVDTNSKSQIELQTFVNGPIVSSEISQTGIYKNTEGELTNEKGETSNLVSFDSQPAIKQEQLTMDAENSDDNYNNYNDASKDILDTGQNANGLFIKEECIERSVSEEESQNNVEQCMNNLPHRENSLFDTATSDTGKMFETVIKEEFIGINLNSDGDMTEDGLTVKLESMGGLEGEEEHSEFDQTLIKEEFSEQNISHNYFDDPNIQQNNDEMILNHSHSSDFEQVVPVSLKSNSEFHNGSLIKAENMEEEIIIPSTLTISTHHGRKLRSRKLTNRRNKELIISDKCHESDFQDMSEGVGDLLAPRGFECPVCHKKYQNIITLQRHQKTHQTVEVNPPLPPPETISVKSLGVMAKDGIYSCSCGKGFRRRSSALACVKAHRKAGFPCQWCTLVFQRQTELRKHCKKEHVSLMHSKPRCTTCKKTFTHKRGLARHVLVHSKDSKKREETAKAKQADSKEAEVIILDTDDDEVKEMQQCKFCNIDFKTEAELRSHLICAHPVIHSRDELNSAKKEPVYSVKFKFNCRTCGKGYPTLGALTSHNKTEHKKVKVTFDCERCKEAFPTRSELSSHRRLHCRGVPTPALPTRSELSSHRRPHCRGVPTPAPPPAPSPHSCDVCGQTFRSAWHMGQHRATHPFLTFATDDNTNTKIFFK